tara:strand:- start:41 stop:1117 length:1077 start_codon:yes stop_codon:yes gene_type:complete
MKIKKVSTPQEVRLFDGDYVKDLDPTDVVEIFQTPLTGSYNWDYTVQDNRIKKLYELGKELNWNVETDIDWTPEFKGMTDEEFEFENSQWERHPVYKTWDTEKRKDFFRDLSAWSLSQFLHGEQGALLVASQLASCAPTFNAKLYAASQTFDEARHVEAFNKYLQTRMKKSWPIGRALKGLLDKILTDPRWDLKFIGMQVVIEGLALAAFQTSKESSSDEVYKNMIELIIRDEARHVTFGINYLTDFVKTLSEEEQIDRAKFALEACTVSRNRLRPYDVWEAYGMGIEETEEYQRKEIFQAQFQDILFSRIMPNLKRIGLLREELVPEYEKMGVMGYANGDSDYETSWEELSKPLKVA